MHIHKYKCKHEFYINTWKSSIFIYIYIYIYIYKDGWGMWGVYACCTKIALSLWWQVQTYETDRFLLMFSRRPQIIQTRNLWLPLVNVLSYVTSVLMESSALEHSIIQSKWHQKCHTDTHNTHKHINLYNHTHLHNYSNILKNICHVGVQKVSILQLYLPKHKANNEWCINFL